MHSYYFELCLYTVRAFNIPFCLFFFILITGQIKEHQPLFETVDKSQLFRRSRRRVAYRGRNKNGYRT